VVEIRIPPLRERPDDIPLLAEFFLRRITRRNGMARMRLSHEAVAALQAHRWPGNVRELENTIARACALASSEVLLPADIPLAQAPAATRPGLREALDRLLLGAPAGTDVIAWLGRETAERALEHARGEIKDAAAALGIPAAALRRLLGRPG
jgi:DNA-binding NtrC family response regulator